jgi:hypothetical protein
MELAARPAPDSELSKSKNRCLPIFLVRVGGVVYRCPYSYYWRALSDARLVLR